MRTPNGTTRPRAWLYVASFRAGLSLNWVKRPPLEYELGKEFKVIYKLDATDEFFDWAVVEGYFPGFS